MSCLAAFLALFACFAGIFQFLRRKQSSRTSLRSGDPQHPQEVVTLNGSTPTQPFPASDISPSHIPNSVEYINFSLNLCYWFNSEYNKCILRSLN